MDYSISTDPGRLEIATIHRYLAEESYWARGIPLEVLEKAIRHSLCFGAYADSGAYTDGAQVGFARVITDYATFGYIADVFVVAAHRGRGVSKLLMKAIMNHPELRGFRRWQLGTDDAHGLYAQFGFGPPAHPERLMEIADRDVYRRPR